MKYLNSLVTLVVASASVAGASTAMTRKAVREAALAAPQQFGGVTMMAHQTVAQALTADFTVEGASSLAPVYTDNFDNGIEHWKITTPNDYITWEAKQIGEPGTAKSFSAIDPDDVKSLYVDGPYQTYRRAKSDITSPAIEVPAQGVLTFYAGYSLNYNDVASLTLTLSTDGFETSTTLWCSIDEQGEKPWAWRPVKIDLTAWAGQTVNLRFEYGPGTGDIFGTGGYLGDFAIDGLTVSGLKPVEAIDVLTGETITLIDITAGDVASRLWTMPGATPATSTEASPTIYYTADGVYDITLTVTDSEGGESSLTRTAFVSVTGTAPVAHIIPPATFRNSANRKALVAPMAPVRFVDGSTGFPTEREWIFAHTDDDPDLLYFTEDENPVVSFAYLHDKPVGLTVSNAHGTSSDLTEVTAEYSAVVTNLRPDDTATTFDMEDWGLFPGSNTRKITAWGEKFSAPSTPVMIDGAYVYFNRADAEEISDQIANVGVHLYTAKDGLPDRRIDSWWWSVYELDLPSGGEMVGTAFPFTDCPFVSDEFFIVVDGIPEFSETCAVSFGMARLRGEGNTAYMLKEGKWMPVSDYFSAGANHTSLLVYPSIHHSVMASLAEDKVVKVGPKAGTVDYTVFSYLGYETPVKSDAEWLRATGEPNGMTVDDIHIEYDALPAGVESRTGTLTLTDGASTLDIVVEQSVDTSVDAIDGDMAGDISVFPTIFTDTVGVYGVKAGDVVAMYNLAGATVTSAVATDDRVMFDGLAVPRGAYVIVVGDKAFKVIKK